MNERIPAEYTPFIKTIYPSWQQHHHKSREILSTATINSFSEAEGVSSGKINYLGDFSRRVSYYRI